MGHAKKKNGDVFADAVHALVVCRIARLPPSIQRPGSVPCLWLDTVKQFFECCSQPSRMRPAGTPTVALEKPTVG